MAGKKTMKITVLGSGTCVPSLDRRPCSILVQQDDINILVDAGPGIMGQLLKTGITINDLDLILLSHFHLDHCAEIAPLLFALKYSGLEHKKHLTLAGGNGLKAHLSQLNLAHSGSIEMDPDHFSICEFDADGCLDFIPDTAKIAGDTKNSVSSILISYVQVAHKPESRAYRFTETSGFSVVYSGDTDVCESLVKLSKEADVLICESSFPDQQKVPGHLTPSLAGKIASDAGVKQLILTHFYPECDQADILAQCRSAYAGPVVLATDLFGF